MTQFDNNYNIIDERDTFILLYVISRLSNLKESLHHINRVEGK